MVSLFWIEGRISDRLLFLPNGINRLTRVSYLAPSEKRQVKGITSVCIFPMDKRVGRICISVKLELLCKVFPLFFFRNN